MSTMCVRIRPSCQTLQPHIILQRLTCARGRPLATPVQVYGVNGQTGYNLLSGLLCDDAVLKALHVDGSPNAAPVCKWTFETPLDYNKVNVGCR